MPSSVEFKETAKRETAGQEETAGSFAKPESNLELQLASDLVEQTACSIFLTGKAGTGKTTFLKNLHKKTTKNMVITAPTGVAAINAGGVTLHSFFQLPLGPFIPGSELHQGGSGSQYRMTREKRNLLQNLDLLVIDEISMVRADILDAVDSVLCRYRKNNLPFGGVQLLMIGDLHQLPPVAKREEWDLLRQVYNSVYFFSSKALARTTFVSIELTHVYRQTDEKFIALLNQLRENRLDAQTLSELNQRYVKDYTPENDQGYITLTTHNAGAEAINNSRLQGLTGGEYSLVAEIKGEFQKNNYPAPDRLRLKEGAQVMFLRNDTSAEKSYFNGKIGKIRKITPATIEIVCPGQTQAIAVEPVVWENIKYSLNEETMKIEAKVIGTFKQFPLKLAWAITIHKSQGLTFEKAIIDAEAAFVHGQTYVALSRCRTLAGVVLSSPLSPHGIEPDQAISGFYRHLREHAPSATYLNEAKIKFQQGLLLDCFDFKPMKYQLSRFVQLLLDRGKIVLHPGIEDLKQVLDRAERDIFTVSEKFKRQLQQLCQNSTLPESDPHIQERLNKASLWFQEQLTTIVTEPLATFHVETDDSLVKAQIDDALQQLEKEIAIKWAGIKAVENGFSPTDYQHRIRQAQIGKPSGMEKDSLATSETDHSELITELKKWRLNKANAERTTNSQILSLESLMEIAKTLPHTMEDLKKITGVAEATIHQRGKEILKIVNRYRKRHTHKNNHSHPVHPQRQGNSKKLPSETKKISFDLFKSGLTIAEIAAKRGLSQATVEVHLCFYIEQGKLDINRLLPLEKQALIKEKLKVMGTDSLKAIKEQLGADFSYGQIRMVVALSQKNP